MFSMMFPMQKYFDISSFQTIQEHHLIFKQYPRLLSTQLQLQLKEILIDDSYFFLVSYSFDF